MKRKLSNIHGAALLVAGFCVSTVLSPIIQARPIGQAHATGKIKGSVFDPNDAVIAGVKIIIVGTQFRAEVISNDIGEFELEVPVGLYRMSTEQGVYYALRRATFYVDANSTTTINIRPSLRVISIGLAVTRSGVREPVTIAPAPKYEVLTVRPASSLDLILQFGKRRAGKRAVEYENVRLSYDSLTIYADMVRLEKGGLKISAKGNVVVDSNGSLSRALAVILIFKNGVPELALS